VALLGGAQGPLSLSELARAAGIDKGQMSRVVSGLAKRGLVVREADSADGRGVRLALSRPGRRLYAGLMRAAAQRDSAFNDCLSDREKQVFAKVLHKLADAARAMIREEKGN
jgi:DNA-binding MarR family transcriptional regulator